MWVIAAFDLPVENSDARREYREFRKLLLEFGFSPFQKSLFFRWIASEKRVGSFLAEVRKQAPAEGDILLFTLPDSTFQKTLHIRDGVSQTMPILPEEWQIF